MTDTASVNDVPSPTADLKRTLVGGLIALALVLTLFALTAQWVYALAFFVFATGFVSATLSPTIQTRLNDPRRTAVVVIMQRLHPEDVAGVIIGRTSLA